MRVSEFLQRIVYYLKHHEDPNDSSFRFKIIAYRAVIDKIKREYMLGDNVTRSQILAIPGISDRMIEHLGEIYNLKKFKSYKSKRTTTIDELVDLNGIGHPRAKALYDDHKVRSIKDLMKPKIFKTLPKETQLFLKYKPLRKIPHEVITTIYEIIESEILSQSQDVLHHHIVGSYRRRKPFSRDIDLMVVSPSSSIIADIIDRMHASTMFDFHVYCKGADKVSGILVTTLVINGRKDEIAVKFDIFRTNIEEYPFMLLYSTGSKEFNVQMRQNAKRKGYLLNQKNITSNNNCIVSSTKFKTESDIFDFLNMKYTDPWDRT